MPAAHFPSLYPVSRSRSQMISSSIKRLAYRRILGVLATWCIFLSGCGMTELYPQVPVVSTFGCFFDNTKPNAITACGNCSNAVTNLTNTPENCSSFEVSEDATTPPSAAPSTTPPSAASFTALSEEPDPCSCTIKEALSCAENTRQIDADFLMCREERQLGLGAGIALLAAGAGGAFSAGSIVAAGIVGSIAGGALGLDYGTFNSAKSPAFGNATAQVDCIYRSTLPTAAEQSDISKKYQAFNKAFGNVATHCKITSEDQNAIWRLYKAEDLVGERQEKYAEEQLKHFGLNVYLAVVSSQVDAFAASQNGIVTPSNIQSGLTAMSYTIPSAALPSPSAAPSPSTAATKEAMTAFLAQMAENQETCRTAFSAVEQTGTAFHASLAAFQLPDPQFQQCLSLSSGAPAAASSASASPSGSKSPKGTGTPAANPTGGPASPNGGSPSSGAGGPSASPSNSAGAPASSGPSPLQVVILTNNAAVDNSKFSAGVSLQVTGGVPPYYWFAVDDGVEVVNPEVRLPRAADLPAAENPIQRVLIADQGGSQQIVYVMPSPTPSATPTPCPTPVH
jgi:hypothetical protein